jgi:GxxExxY protein
MTRKEEKPELIYKDESYTIIGACFAVYKDKGCGFHEPVYHECLEIELEFQRIPFLSKRLQTLQYRDRTLVQTFSPDFICYNKIVLEIKAVSELIDEHRAQLLNYLSATGCGLGLLAISDIIQGWNTSASSLARRNHRMSVSEILASFRVFRGQNSSAVFR